MEPDTSREWLEADGLGGFASGTPAGIRTRRYHALLLAAMRPPGERWVLVNGCETVVETPAGRWPLSAQRYAPDVTHPDGFTHLEAFAPEPWPRWRHRLPDGTALEQQLVARHGEPVVALAWKLLAPRRGVTLRLRPLLSGRDPHALHHENPAFRFGRVVDGPLHGWRPYDGVPAVVAVANGEWSDAPCWYRNFQYDAERERGLDFLEDLASPGEYRFDLSAGEAAWVIAADTPAARATLAHAAAPALARELRRRERARRARFATPLHRAADAYLVERGRGRTVIAGYPWFGDWGRDTFVALRGLCLATRRLDDARAILATWAEAVADGLLPNRFADAGGAPEYNSVDAPLWFVVACGAWRAAMARAGRRLPRGVDAALRGASEAILAGFARGTRFGIRADADGLLAAGVPGVQLTWMDAKVGDRVVTPRAGKPVEVQALWFNALRAAADGSPHWGEMAARVRASFAARFWDPSRGHLHDVVDVDHVPGRVDSALRPNQLFAVGGLPQPLLEGEPAARVVEACERALWTPLGPRSLAPGEPGYAPRYAGGPAERDAAYHQGTVWPWLAGAFVEAWLRTHGGSPEARRQARQRFVAPLLRHLDEAGLGHVSEIADAEPPHAPRGAPFQAWSLAELARLELDVLAAEPARAAAAGMDSVAQST